MKSYMRNQQISPIQATRQNSRLDVLAKQQKLEHEHLLASHNKEMQAFRDIIKLTLEKSESLSQRNEQDLKEFRAYAEKYIFSLNERIKRNEISITEQTKSLSSFHEGINDFRESYVNKNLAEKFKKEIDTKIENVSFNQINSYQKLQKEFKDLFNFLESELEKLNDLTLNRLNELVKTDEKNFSILRIEREGIFKELYRYKKCLFIMEKKIENIYTLLNRMKQRCDKCQVE